MEEPDLNIIKAIGEKEGLKMVELKRASGLCWQTVYNRLESLELNGYVQRRIGGFPKTCRLHLTDKGQRVFESLKRMEKAEEAQPVQVDVAEAVEKRALKTINYAAPLLAKQGFISFLKAYLTELGIAISRGYLKPGALNREAQQLARRIYVAIYPPAEGDHVARAVLAFLRHMLEDRETRLHIAKKRRLTVLLSLDMQGLERSDEEVATLLFWAFVFEGLHKEGKI